MAVLVVMLLPLAAGAVDDTPTEVLDARNGVVRVVTVLQEEGYVSTGTGFVVGTEDKYYVVTNYHVIEDYKEIYIYYDTGKYIEAAVYKDDPSRDLCILKPKKKIPDVVVLDIESDPIDSGIAVFALGFPGASDTLSEGFDPVLYDSVNDYLKNVVADNQSMTITNGIVSAIRDSNMVGNSTRQVALLQTNTAINRGNSGGPLVNKSGRVVGINTLGITGMEWHIEAMNGAIHVDELRKVLKNAKIEYNTTPEPVISSSVPVSSQPEEPQGIGGMAILLIALVVLAGGGVALALVLRRGRKKPAVPGGVSLAAYAGAGQVRDEISAIEMTLAFINELLGMGVYDLNPLLTPENVIIGDGQIALKDKKIKVAADAKREIYPGFSAPEAYKGEAGQPASVYFVGGMLFTLITGQRPPDALLRKEQQVPAFINGDTLQNIINQAMEPAQPARVQDLYALYELLNGYKPNIYAENGYGGYSQY